ncbi:amidohydrolase [candidate division KSB1 bacterium]
MSGKQTLIILLSILLILAGCGSKEAADLVLNNGKIITMNPDNPEAEAVAVIGGRIVAVGSTSKIEDHIAENTKVIDLNGMLTVPGLIDCHGHYMSLGESLMGIDLKYAKTWDEIVGMVAEEVKNKNPGEWITGRGWHQDKWERPPMPNIEGLPVHTSLSRVSPNNPVMLIHTSGHGVFVNKKAMDEIGISKDTPDPEGGEFLRGWRGNPTGMLRETAQDPARDAYAEYFNRREPEEVEAELREHVRLAAENALKNGITTFHDMGETFEIIDLFKKMAEEGNLPVRLYAAIQESADRLQERLPDYRLIGYGDGFLTVRMIGEKVLDGALGTHGGWLLEPYTDMPRSTGFNVTPVDDIRRSAELAMEYDFQMAIQGIGDRATRELLNIYEDEFAGSPDKNDLRWRIEHCQVIHPYDLPRFKQLGVIFSVRGIFATSDAPWVMDRLGVERTRERGYLYQTMFKSGAVVINGTDPPVESIDPIDNFYRSVTRKLSDGSVFFPEQRMTREQALMTYTVNAAFAGFEEDDKGTIEPGKLADFTVFTKDIMAIPDDELLSAEIAFTIIDGKVKYENK